MKKKFLGLALVVVAITITSICLCGFGVKTIAISDEDMANVRFGGAPTAIAASNGATVISYDSCVLAVNHTVTDYIPNLANIGLPNMHPALSIGNVLAHSQRSVPNLIPGGSIFTPNGYENDGVIARNMLTNLYGRMDLDTQEVSFLTIQYAYSNYAFEQNCSPTTRLVAKNAKYIVPEKLDTCVVTYNTPIVLYSKQVETVTGIMQGANSLTFNSQMIYANQVHSAFKYTRYHYIKDGIEYDEMFLTSKDNSGRNVIIRLGGDTLIYRIEGLFFQQ